ncbi:LOW QUALITY PROTEIN: hypothetical protein N5P37_005680 [Trichoderma harzianum]|nr:LOW QUALITY PROTEIN: hypothetical protein N5P37_005680 [Trichoderma harzianum]
MAILHDAESYWRDTFVGSEHTPFPALPSFVQQPTLSAVVHHEVFLPSSQNAISTPMLIRAAWALVAGQMTNSEDVVFGIVFKDKSSQALGNSSNGTPNSYPLRIKWSKEWTVSQFLNTINQQAKELAPFEAIRVQDYASISSEVQRAYSFQTLLDIELAEIVQSSDEQVSRQKQMDNVALYLSFQVHSSGVAIEANFDERVTELWKVRKLLSQFDFVLDQLHNAPVGTTIADVDMVTESDLATIWERNKILPAPIQRCIHSLFEERALARPEAIALHAWDGEMTYGELNRLSTLLAWRLVDSGVTADVLVPVCFEKSMWTMVALLGVMKAGGAFVLLDPSLPSQRLATIIQKTKSDIALSSRACFDIVLPHVQKTIIIEGAFFKDLSHDTHEELDRSSPESLMYVVFTSGSTGTPKGAMVTHQNLASAMHYEKDHYQLDETSRIYDFSSYGFIVSIVNMFNAICSGSCVCIPRDEDRRNKLADSINSLRANIIHLTPSAANVLDPDEVPGIKTVVFSGEGLHADAIKKWWGKVRVLNVYGQAECAPRAIINDSATTPAEVTRIGRGHGQKTWIVDPRDHNKLVPFGCIGELLLEGPQGDGASPMLAAFLVLDNAATDAAQDGDNVRAAKIHHITADSQKRLSDSLPVYMIPTVFFSVVAIPKTVTNKINRRQLREMGSAYSVQELAEMRTQAGGPKREPKKPMEKHLHALWSRILNLKPSSIGLGDSFIQLGGDSIAAMKVASEGRKIGIDLSVATILSNISLEEVADNSLYIEQDMLELIKPFSLLPNGEDVSGIVKEAAKLCGTEESAILDIYPCTPLQEGLFSLALASSLGDYIAQYTLEISNEVNVEPTDGLESYLKADRQKSMGIGQPLSRFALIKNSQGSVKWLTWTLHHATYDGWSFPLLLRALNDAYRGSILDDSPPFNRFIKYISERDDDSADKYWQDTLGDFDNAPFPTLPASVPQPITDTIIEHSVTLTGQQKSSNITLSTLIRAAWGLVMGASTNTADVVFGMPVSGRTAPVIGIDSMAGPTLATVPVRLRWNNNLKLMDYLESVHRQTIEMMPFEQTGLRRIAKNGPGCEQACAFQTLVLIQPDLKSLEDDSLGKWTGIRDRESTYALMLEIEMGTNGFTTTASFDSRAIKPWIVRLLLERLEHVSEQLWRADSEALLSDVETMTKHDQDIIWGWNHDLPERVNELLHNIIHERAIENPESLALCAWDGDMTYKELDDLSTKLAFRLVDEGVVANQIVPVCFEKSKWATVSMLGVLKAGGGFVLLDSALPEQRLATIVKQVNPRVLLSSGTNLSLATRLASNVIQVDEGFFQAITEQPGCTLVDPSPESIMYVVFTSGSTGTPKGVLLSHRNFASAVRHQQPQYQVDTRSRVYDFASYSFDVAVMNVFNTLAWVTWIVDPDNHDVLVPPGCVGELLLEGPCVGLGYLNEPGKTAAVFIDDPLWLVKGTPDHVGRRGRLYKTGDLVQYTENGFLTFLGRKDMQVKIRGQRVELGELECRIHEFMHDVEQAVAEVIVPQGPGARPTLATFLCLGEEHPDYEKNPSSLTQVYHMPAEIQDQLHKVLPVYMVPSVYFKVAEIPMTPSGKINRKGLREIGASFTVQELAKIRTAEKAQKRKPTTRDEKTMQEIWSDLLEIDLDAIGLSDDFFQLGGDSIAAMKMVSMAREQDIEITVADVFRHPTLGELVGGLEGQSSTANVEVRPFDLIGVDTKNEDAVKEIAAMYGLVESNILDVYPSTPLQEGLLSLSSKQPGDYIWQMTLALSENISIENFRSAWERVFKESEVLRTRIVQYGTLGSLQVILDETIEWIETSGLEEYQKLDRGQIMEPGQRLWFVWTIHHALYDGWSMPRMMDLANRIYTGRKLEPCLSFNRFIQYVSSQDTKSATDYWTKSLGNCDHVAFPTLPASIREPAPSQVASEHILLDKNSISDITTSTLAHAAWAIVVGRISGGEDVVFGSTVSGRGATIAGIEEIVGPTIATVPMRIKWSKEATITNFLQDVQSQRTEMISFEQTGLQQIAKMSPDCAKACNFQTLLIIQPQDGEEQESAFGKWQNDEGKNSNTYPLTLFITLGSSEISVKASFDSRVIEPLTMQRLLEQFKDTVLNLHENIASSSKTLQDLQVLPLSDLRTLWTWNSTVPDYIDKLLHSVIEDQAQVRPAAPAIHAWDGDFTYSELDSLSTSLASHLIGLGFESGVAVPLCFEKSKWTIVSLFAVLKAGGAFVLLDTSLPEQRLQSIVEQLDSGLLLSSSEASQRFSLFSSRKTIVVDASLFKEISGSSQSYTKVSVSSKSLAYVVFTSGSTGTPKGVQVSHRNLATAIHHQQGHFKYSDKSRFLDFASYSFDMSLFTIFHNFSAGGCLCIPRDEDRRNNLAKTIAALNADTLVLTPSVSRSLKPADVPGVKSILWCGEALHSKDAEPWFGNIHAINTYGPSECTPVTTINYEAKGVEEMGYIGRGVGVATWVVDAENYNQLVPIGHVGELLLEGPLVGLGYLNAPEKTAEAFVGNPEWLVKGFETNPGRQGRLYRTGDLVRYTNDHNIVFVGRKHTKVKMRGQWVELGDVAYQVGQHIPNAKQVVAEVIAPGGDETRPLLAAFLELDSKATAAESLLEFYQTDSQLEAALAATLPKHMIPDVYFSVVQIPMTAAGKTNRGRLRELGATFTIQQLAELRTAKQGPKRQPQTAAEMQMQSIWSRILQIEQDAIGLDDNFFELGGDSITAMMLVGAARKHGLTVNIVSIFRNPRLEELARLVSHDTSNIDAVAGSEQHQLLGTAQKSALLAEIDSQSDKYELRSVDVAEILPLTDFQFNLVNSSMSLGPLFCNYFFLDLESSPDITHLEEACAWALERLPILRARFLPLLGSFWQVIPRQVQKLPLQILNAGNEEDLAGFSRGFCFRDQETLKATNAPFAVFLFRSDAKSARIVLRISHTQYDGISLPHIFNSILHGRQNASSLSPSLFTDYLIKTHRHLEKSREYWTSLLHRSSVTTAGKYLPQLTALSPRREAVRLERNISIPQLPLGITPATLLSSAWAILLSRLTGKEDIIYSQLIAGRNAAIEGVEDIVGPCVNIIPMRASFDSLETPSKLLESIQHQFIAVGEADGLGLRDIREHCTEWPADAVIDSVIVHQNINETPDFQAGQASAQLQSFDNPHHIQSKIWLTSRPRGDVVNIEFQANTHMMTAKTAEAILASYCEIATGLFLKPDVPLAQLVGDYALNI